MRFENLSADTSIDWMGRAFSTVISSELSETPNLDSIGIARIRAAARVLGPAPSEAPGVSAERYPALAANANRIGYGVYWLHGGKLEARLEIADPSRPKDIQVLTASAPAGDLLSAATALARRISPRAAHYGTASPAALQNYAAALDASSSSAIEDRASQAIAADPDFGPPYALLAPLQAQHDRDGALALLDRALSQPRIEPASRTELQVLAARLRGQPAQVENALGALAKLRPADVENWKSFAEAAYALHDYPQALSAWQKTASMAPNDPSVLNQLAYAAAYTGDLAAATSALRHYASLRPSDPNPLDSLGDVNFINGHLKEAEDFYVQAVNKDPNFYGGADWFKAAMARLMTGDVSGADGLADRFVQARTAAHDPSTPFFQAEWQWISGRRKVAVHALEQFERASENGPTRDLASRAASQLAVWSLAMGDRSGAEQMAAKAMSLAAPASSAEAAIVRFLALPPAPAAEWQTRVERFVPNPAQQTIRDNVLSKALLFSRQFAPAVDVLRRLYDSPAESNDETLPVQLAWAYLETGRDKEAEPLLKLNPVPPVAGPNLYTPLYFPRLFELRARLAQKQGDTKAAEENRKIFAALGGTGL